MSHDMFVDSMRLIVQPPCCNGEIDVFSHWHITPEAVGVCLGPGDMLLAIVFVHTCASICYHDSCLGPSHKLLFMVYVQAHASGYSL